AAFKDYQGDDGEAPVSKKPTSEQAAAPKKSEKEPPKKSDSTSKTEQEPAAGSTAKTIGANKDGSVFASPFARKLAQEKSI
ncbi:unnamed protein product, partial [Rotaria magnacalcarata]